MRSSFISFVVSILMLSFSFQSFSFANEYATIDLSVARRNYHIPSQFAFSIEDNDTVVVSTDLRYTHNGLGDPAAFNQHTFGLLLTSDNPWWAGQNDVITAASRGAAIGNRLPANPWVENWLPHTDLEVDPVANLDPDTMEPIDEADRVDQVSIWIRQEWELYSNGFGYIEGVSRFSRVDDDELLFETTPFELGMVNDGEGYESGMTLFGGYTTGWDPGLEGIDVPREKVTNISRVDVDNFTVTLNDDVIFSDDFSSYTPNEPIGGGLTADPPHNWNPKWQNIDPDGVPDSGDEDTSQQTLFRSVGTVIEPSCSIPDGGIGGDFDDNGKVEFADFLLLSDNFSTDVSTYEEGDADCDGMVAFSDFLILSDNFGATAVAAAVPEPSSIVLLASCCFGLLLRRRNRA